MPWKRRQPTWPYLVALGCLFALTLAAPGWWHRRRPSPAPAAPPTVLGGQSPFATLPTPPTPRSGASNNNPQAGHPAATPVLPPLAGRGVELEAPTVGAAMLAAPSLDGAVVESDDYVVIDEPLIDPQPTVAAPPPRSATPAIETNLKAVEAEPSAVAHGFDIRPLSPEDGATLASTAPALPTRPVIAVDAILRARDAIVALMDAAQRRTQELAHAAAQAAIRPAPPRQNRPRVVVESSDDRLAMIPDMVPPAPLPDTMLGEFSLAGPVIPEPTLAEPELQFPASPEPTLAEPHLAMLPSPAAEPLPAPALRHRPTALIRQLESLAQIQAATSWSERVMGVLQQLTTAPAPEPAAAIALVHELRDLSTAGFNQALAVRVAAEQSAWIRAARALDRRLPVWMLLVQDPKLGEFDGATGHYRDAALLRETLNEAAALTAGSAEGDAWRAYLRLDDLAGLTSVGGGDYREERRAAAREVLLRMVDPQLTPDQAKFLAQPSLAALVNDLRPWASGEASLDALAALIEKYELTGALGDAETIAELRLRMKWSDDPRLVTLADELNRNYRNANVRLAISASLFNRMIPAEKPVTNRVNERVGGAEVRGRSHTATHVHLRLIPHATEWRLGLEVDGAVDSNTYTDVGPARVRNVSRMEYDAQKLITLSREGLQIDRAQVQVRGRNSLAGVESRLDGVPVVGALVEDVIRRRHREGQASAVAQVKSKVNRQVRTRMDREADEKLHALESKCSEGLVTPLARFALWAEPIDMSTTAERAVVRIRLANEQHLGAHTPRPSAPSDSLASVQLHESALNNAIRGLGLDGRRITVGELHGLLLEKFTNRPEAPPADLPQKAIVHFAPHDAIRVSCHDDCVELILNIVELRKGRDRIRNVGVHAFFRPVVDGLDVRFVRDGTLQFEGAHLRSGPRLVLHSVFGKLLRRDQEAPVLAARLGADPRLDGLMVTQLVIDDGWVALSVGPATPNRTAWRTRAAATR